MNDEGARAGENTGGAAGTAGTGGTSGTPSVGGTGGVTTSCRLYASKYTRTSGFGDELFECAWDGPTITMSCRGGISPRITLTETWATLEDAVRHDTPVGNYTSVSSTLRDEFANSLCEFTFTMPRDTLGRRLAQEAIPGPLNTCGTIAHVYDGWDSEGRPTHGLAHDVGNGDCVGQNVSIEYDDANYTVSWSQSGGTSCFDGIISTTSNADRLIESVTVYDTTFEYTTLETGEICLE